MKIYLAALGSRGDNEPFRALATRAAAHGHEVFFAHTSDLSSDPLAPYEELELPGSMEKVIADQGVSTLRALLNYRSVMQPLLGNVWDTTTRQILDIRPDVVVYHPKVMTAATAAHAVGALAAEVEIVPTVTPTSEFPSAGIPLRLPPSWNRVSYSWVRAGLSSFQPALTKLAAELGVIRTQSDIVLCPVSPTLVPQPADWPDFAHVTGQWQMPSVEPLDPQLEEFLSGGNVFYAGFGSMRDTHGRSRAQALVSAARALGMKTLLTTGWGGLVPSPEHQGASDVLIRSSLPHSQVLPTVSAGIHHGGAGTTHAMVRAGTPSIIMPFLGDQPWWAGRLETRGLGPRALSRRETRPSVIARAITEALSTREAVTSASRAMASDDGLGEALRIVEQAEAGVSPLRPS
ncbi:MAG: glycosyltransferase [Actinomycetota bacterium]|nr:glycosyltransferase [Actinomycetota bacterium]